MFCFITSLIHFFCLPIFLKKICLDQLTYLTLTPNRTNYFTSMPLKQVNLGNISFCKEKFIYPFLLPFAYFLDTTYSGLLPSMFSEKTNSCPCNKPHIIRPVDNFPSRSSSSVTSVLPNQGQANYRQLVCAYLMKSWSFPQRFPVNGIQYD